MYAFMIELAAASGRVHLLLTHRKMLLWFSLATSRDFRIGHTGVFFCSCLVSSCIELNTIVIKVVKSRWIAYMYKKNCKASTKKLLPCEWIHNFACLWCSKILQQYKGVDANILKLCINLHPSVALLTQTSTMPQNWNQKTFYFFI